jgi:hypothetical protein
LEKKRRENHKETMADSRIKKLLLSKVLTEEQWIQMSDHAENHAQNVEEITSDSKPVDKIEDDNDNTSLKIFYYLPQWFKQKKISDIEESLLIQGAGKRRRSTIVDTLNLKPEKFERFEQTPGETVRYLDFAKRFETQNKLYSEAAKKNNLSDELAENMKVYFNIICSNLNHYFDVKKSIDEEGLDRILHVAKACDRNLKDFPKGDTWNKWGCKLNGPLKDLTEEQLKKKHGWIYEKETNSKNPNIIWLKAR